MVSIVKPVISCRGSTLSLYFQDSVLIVPFLLLFDFPVLLHSLLCFLAAFLHRGFCQDHGHDSHYAGLQDSYHVLLTVFYHIIRVVLSHL